MNKKGFTLMELLAVIVILAIIAIIAIPIIINVINTAKKGALKDSGYGIIDAVELYIANNLKDGISSNIKFDCVKDKCTNGTKEINYKGNIDNGTLILTTTSKILVCVDDGKNYALKLENEKKLKVGTGTCGEYEENNGTFNIVDSPNTRIAELERENQEQKTYIDELENNIIVANWLNDAYTTSTNWTIMTPKLYNNSFFDWNNNNLVVKKGGKYKIYYQSAFDGGTAGSAAIRILINGTVVGSCSASYARCDSSEISYASELNVNDTIRVEAYTSTSYWGARAVVAIVKVSE